MLLTYRNYVRMRRKFYGETPPHVPGPFCLENVVMVKKSFGFVVAVIFLCFGVSAMAQGPIPLPEHEMLKMDEGVWNAKISMWGAVGTEPTIGMAKETSTMIGELWSIGLMEGNIGGNDFVGHATLGYDPMQKKYVGTWIDSVTPVIAHMSGTYESETKTLTLFYITYAEDGQAQERKNIMVYKDENTRDFTMFLKSGDEWTRAMGILYERVN
jgi:hypothetical protein